MSSTGPEADASAGRVGDQLPAEPSAPPTAARVLPVGRLQTTFVALQERDFRIFWLGQLVSVTGTWMQIVAQGWLVFVLSDSPFVLGVAAAARSVPVLFLAFVAGFVADRYDRRRIILASNVVSMIVTAILGILTVTGSVDVATVIAAALLLGLANAFEMPARQSYVAELAGPRSLANAIALNSLLFNSARVLGPTLAGFLVAVVGPGWAFLVNAVSFGPVIVGLLLIRHAHVPRLGIFAREALPEVVRYLRGEPRVTILLALLASQTIFASGHFILGPAVAVELGQGAEGLGVMLSAAGAGAVVGGLRLAATANRTSRSRLLLTAGLALAVGLVGVWLSQSYAIALVFFVLAGWGAVSFNASANTLIQTIVPDRLRGRIMSLYVMVLLGFMPIAGLLQGAVADRLTSTAALGLGGLAYGLTIVAAFVLVRALRRL
ncbi:MAG TPA: MFS transporter [Candidatus Deferrimicrobiaceae bacterium]|nr:MFS transporter [Candidatus Deferrimicrobiaceae bacterium]